MTVTTDSATIGSNQRRRDFADSAGDCVRGGLIFLLNDRRSKAFYSRSQRIRHTEHRPYGSNRLSGYDAYSLERERDLFSRETMANDV